MFHKYPNFRYAKQSEFLYRNDFFWRKYYFRNNWERYKDHPSINLIKSKNSCSANTFPFTPVSIEEVKRAIESLDPKKAAQKKRYTNTLKQNSDFFAFHFQKDINPSISTSKFPYDLKETNVIPVYKKKSKLSKKTIGQ